MRTIRVLTLTIVLALPGLSQTFGQITGVVTDPSGAVNYAFPALLPGVYNVRAEMSGFQAEIRSGVELQVQQTARIDFQLKVGGVAEAVEVQGGAPLLATENATGRHCDREPQELSSCP